MLRENTVKQKIKAGVVQFGYLQSLQDPCITEILGNAGYDFVMLDSEHSPLSPAGMENLSRVGELTGICPLVRVPGTTPRDIGRLLDAGAAGIIVPNVRTRADVEQAVKSSLYLPEGERGLSMPRQAGFGAMPMPEFVGFANKNLLITIQIETREALADIENIVAVPGVDVALLGPLDMSAALGVLGQMDHPDMQAARRAICAACHKAGVVPGTFAMAPDQIRPLIDMGFRFILLGADLLFIGQSGGQFLAAGRKAAAGN